MASDSLTLDIVSYFFFATYGASIQDLNILTRQKSVPKSQKRIFCVSTLSTPPSFIIFTTILYTPLAPISDNKTPGKEFNLFKKFIIFKTFYFKEKFIIII